MGGEYGSLSRECILEEREYSQDVLDMAWRAVENMAPRHFKREIKCI